MWWRAAPTSWWRLNDKREFKAKVILADPRTDLAVLKIDTKGERLPTVPFGDSDQVQVGDLVLAIGDPFGVGPDRHHGHRLGAGAQPGFGQRLSVLHPDRRRHQSRQFRRRAGDDRWQARRHQHRDLFALRRQYRHRLRHSFQPGAPGGGGRRGRQRRQAGLDRRQRPARDQRDRGKHGVARARWRAGEGRLSRRPAGQCRGQVGRSGA